MGVNDVEVVEIFIFQSGDVSPQPGTLDRTISLQSYALFY